MAERSPVNPFSPSFGTTPPLLAGRDDVLDRFNEAIEAGPTHPDYTMLVTGDRGTGKTALLNTMEDTVSNRGWLTVTAASSSEPLSERIAAEALRSLEQFPGGERRIKLASLNVLGVGLELEQGSTATVKAGRLTSVLEQLGEALANKRVGLLITIDELHDVKRDDVRDVASAVQIATRRRQRPIAFAAAALPLIEHSHLADPHMTFLQRCARAPLDPLTPDETRRALREPIVSHGSFINNDALDEAVDSTLGYPYMIQLVGFHAWRMRTTTDEPISVDDVRGAILEAEHAMVEQVAGPVWNRLSPMDQRFLVAMLQDETDSSMADIASRLGRSPQHARTYRRRLLAAGALSPMPAGRVRFRHHALRRRAQDAARDDPDLTRPQGETTGF
ncbi:MAG: ATP-binding protein [Acidimicrobiaceae bacterium]|nr:ATP-binding protein [Acidimicrobiaceae bacterium]MCY4279406.1 ATP-binding protein [Acidimicrobiaceae bacterium]